MGLRGARLALERPAEAFEAFQGFEGRQTAGLNAFKSTWPWSLAAECLAEELPWMGLRGARLALERPAEAFEGRGLKASKSI